MYILQIFWSPVRADERLCVRIIACCSSTAHLVVRRLVRQARVFSHWANWRWVDVEDFSKRRRVIVRYEWEWMNVRVCTIKNKQKEWQRGTKPQSKVDRVLGFFSMVVRIGTPPPPHPQASLFPFLCFRGEGDTLAGGESGWGVLILTRGQTLWYSTYFVKQTFLMNNCMQWIGTLKALHVQTKAYQTGAVWISTACIA